MQPIDQTSTEKMKWHEINMRNKNNKTGGEIKWHAQRDDGTVNKTQEMNAMQLLSVSNHKLSQI